MMCINRALIRTTRAILQADIETLVKLRSGRHDNETGILIIDSKGRIAIEALRQIVTEFDYRLEIIEAERTNLNDLEVYNSPLRQMARFGYQSDKGYVYVLRGWVPAMADDPRIQDFRRIFGGSGLVIILSATQDEAPSNFLKCDLSDL